MPLVNIFSLFSKHFSVEILLPSAYSIMAKKMVVTQELMIQEITEWAHLKWAYQLWALLWYGYAPVIRLKMAISGRHAHIHTGKTDISRSSDS